MSKYTFAEAKRALKEKRPKMSVQYLESYTGWMVPMRMRCKIHKVEFTESIGSIYHGAQPCQGCKEANKKRVSTKQAGIKLSDKVPHYKLIESSYTSFIKPSEIYCSRHNIYFSDTCHNIISQNKILACPMCKKEQVTWNKITLDKANTILRLKYPELRFGSDYIDAGTPCSVVHDKLGVLDKKYTLRHLVKRSTVLPFSHIKEDKSQIFNIPRKQFLKFLSKHSSRLQILKSVGREVEVRCICSNVFKTTVGNINGSHLGCPKCGVLLRNMMQQLLYAQEKKEALITNGWIPTKEASFKCIYCGTQKRLNGKITQCTCRTTKKQTASHASPISQEWLNRINKEYGVHIKMHYAGKEQSISLKGKNIRVDGYDSKSNTVFEFLGDNWHGNPVLGHNGDRCHPYSEKSRLRLFAESMSRLHSLQSLGFNVIYLWERDYKTGCLISGILPGNLSSSLSSS